MTRFPPQKKREVSSRFKKRTFTVFVRPSISLSAYTAAALNNTDNMSAPKSYGSKKKKKSSAAAAAAPEVSVSQSATSAIGASSIQRMLQDMAPPTARRTSKTNGTTTSVKSSSSASVPAFSKKSIKVADLASALPDESDTEEVVEATNEEDEDCEDEEEDEDEDEEDCEEDEEIDSQDDDDEDAYEVNESVLRKNSDDDDDDDVDDDASLNASTENSVVIEEETETAARRWATEVDVDRIIPGKRRREQAGYYAPENAANRRYA